MVRFLICLPVGILLLILTPLNPLVDLEMSVSFVFIALLGACFVGTAIIAAIIGFRYPKVDGLRWANNTLFAVLIVAIVGATAAFLVLSLATSTASPIAALTPAPQGLICAIFVNANRIQINQGRAATRASTWR